MASRRLVLTHNARPALAAAQGAFTVAATVSQQADIPNPWDDAGATLTGWDIDDEIPVTIEGTLGAGEVGDFTPFRYVADDTPHTISVVLPVSPPMTVEVWNGHIWAHTYTGNLCLTTPIYGGTLPAVPGGGSGVGYLITPVFRVKNRTLRKAVELSIEVLFSATDSPNTPCENYQTWTLVSAGVDGPDTYHTTQN